MYDKLIVISSLLSISYIIIKLFKLEGINIYTGTYFDDINNDIDYDINDNIIDCDDHIYKIL